MLRSTFNVICRHSGNGAVPNSTTRITAECGFLLISRMVSLCSATPPIFYKMTGFFASQYQFCIRWDDPDLAIVGRNVGVAPLTSGKDAAGSTLRDAEVFV